MGMHLFDSTSEPLAMTLRLLLSLMAFLALANGKPQIRLLNRQLTDLNAEAEPSGTIYRPRSSDYSDYLQPSQRCECRPEPRSLNRRRPSSDYSGTDLLLNRGFHPGGHQLFPGPRTFPSSSSNPRPSGTFFGK